MISQTSTASCAQKARLRARLRGGRGGLSAAAQGRAAVGLLGQFRNLPGLAQVGCCALYLARDGEIDPAPIADYLWRRQVRLALPVVGSEAGGGLSFKPFCRAGRLVKNRLGLDEPDTAATVDLAALDLVLLPVVGFDRYGNRLGMGGGYYDRTFAYKIQHPERAPQLIGLAHSFQQVDELAADPWDVPLAGVLTECGYIAARPGG
ncbi:MAG: 5-formyltetrahydrofolate cyclo-ligase [Cellvibrionales bacterium]|nr:5-formyltetrahydrofolate cyclo-ligase [Cellvibrionales bacterium]